VERVLYKGLLRIGERYDKYPLSKVSLEFGGKKKYIPNGGSLKNEIRKNWRSSPANIMSGLENFKYLRNTFNSMERSYPWYSQLTLQSVENAKQQVNKPVLVDQIKPGNVLLAHPAISGAYTKSVILLVQQTNDVVLGVIIPGNKSSYTQGVSLWEGGSAHQEFWLLHTQHLSNSTPIFKNLYISPVPNPEERKQFSPADAKIYCSVTRWSTTQLTSEIETGNWFLTECPPELLFPTKFIDEQNSETTFDLSDDGTKTSDLWKKNYARIRRRVFDFFLY